MKIVNCKKYNTEKNYASNNDACKNLCTDLISSTEKICSNEYCRMILPVNK